MLLSEETKEYYLNLLRMNPNDFYSHFNFALLLENDFKEYVVHSRNIKPDVLNFRQWLEKNWKNE